jgi:hypothetical protein
MGRQVGVGGNLLLQTPEGIFCGFDRYDPAPLANARRKRKGVRPDIGANVDDGAAPRDGAPVQGDGLRLKAAQQENAKVDGFAKIELPIEAAATTFHHMPTPSHSQPGHNRGLHNSRQRKLRFGAENQ